MSEYIKTLVEDVWCAEGHSGLDYYDDFYQRFYKHITAYCAEVTNEMRAAGINATIEDLERIGMDFRSLRDGGDLFGVAPVSIESAWAVLDRRYEITKHEVHDTLRVFEGEQTPPDIAGVFVLGDNIQQNCDVGNFHEPNEGDIYVGVFRDSYGNYDFTGRHMRFRSNRELKSMLASANNFYFYCMAMDRNLGNDDLDILDV